MLRFLTFYTSSYHKIKKSWENGQEILLSSFLMYNGAWIAGQGLVSPGAAFL